MNDAELLQRYADTGCESSFAELVRRHIGLVFSAALRQVNGDRRLAEEVSQTVFTDLARKAGSLSRRVVLTGWLYTSVRFAAAKAIRSEQRRHERETQAFMLQELSTPPPPPEDWARIEAVLDEAMHQLDATDRNAVLLRYFQNHTFQEVGASLGLSQDAARMRVDRALEKLRKLMDRHGVASTTAGLAALLSSQAAAAAPTGLAAAVTGTALASTTAATISFFSIATMTKIQAGALALAVASVSVPLVIQHHTNQDLKTQNGELLRQTEQLASDITTLQKEREQLRVQLAASATKVANPSNEIFKLRDEVTRLRAQAQASAGRTPLDPPLTETLQSLATRAAALKHSLARMPEKAIPEMQFLTEKDWLNAVSASESLETESEQRQALNVLRGSAKSAFGNHLREALKKYSAANNGQIPQDILALQPHFDPPVDAAVLQRYAINRTGPLAEVGKDHDIIVEVAPPVDEEYDSRFSFGRNGTSSRSYSKVSEVIELAARAFAEANNGRIPRNADQLATYLSGPVDSDRVQKFLDRIPSEITRVDQLPPKR
ncbi:MAG TPA: sigma-70 family RNA polymerase sigma factor [Methylomirabilota bacterium]|nr:sigma-70 family RNA polymerase sigma factor [Methylomirabilota bacterium]